ncbi:hypothetical protein DFJ58DRAFT_845387 [Suillus subalutaceus]|uniref:uncharacterized protein n=1 Tax=Suillus subalutaceus TaxID=48586 RepID=UPI001B85D97F|nr:uncharacterized protein DFJ58DRAFT_845387 [Suillus subalutaceus]KAG1840384.1 hypothetical protein DFJ58DRAFT_845387 [Suillus subalutaceus]
MTSVVIDFLSSMSFPPLRTVPKPFPYIPLSLLTCLLVAVKWVRIGTFKAAESQGIGKSVCVKSLSALPGSYRGGLLAAKVPPATFLIACSTSCISLVCPPPFLEPLVWLLTALAVVALSHLQYVRATRMAMQGSLWPGFFPELLQLPDVLAIIPSSSQSPTPLPYPSTSPSSTLLLPVAPELVDTTTCFDSHLWTTRKEVMQERSTNHESERECGRADYGPPSEPLENPILSEGSALETELLADNQGFGYEDLQQALKASLAAQGLEVPSTPPPSLHDT